MRYQIETLTRVVSKADDAAEARTAALRERAAELKTAASLGWTLASTFVLEGVEVATFVDTITFTPPAE
ncbi:hypothetical protein BIU98_00605 [Curtobacterium sp. MMLR14_010]|jgi:hypothetical protein|uniref:hypothetical protein n=1 Tax=unclassified Curtobacterium TaxID=257496 RepID=UPI0008DD7EE6|nr:MULTISPECIES: hypothetical protein [unclassified Curtobacterium]MBF4592107.1 hypothetical protein [Curtobacterium sp. VKM Ac-1395]MCY1692900.1 hypothetical protein [Curtobacterium sp. SL109]OII36085.1 hypothetical protein BIU98_00605 [Curtobacterium sp. MMLR14_010]